VLVVNSSAPLTAQSSSPVGVIVTSAVGCAAFGHGDARFDHNSCCIVVGNVDCNAVNRDIIIDVVHASCGMRDAIAVYTFVYDPVSGVREKPS
jgi:hypothetical protein